MQLSSLEFKDGQNIPSQYTCQGRNISPPLTISGVPAGTKSLVVIVSDPDSPSGNFVHWVIWGINPSTKQFKPGETPIGSRQGINDFGVRGYGGPCPHSGLHRYIFELYALNATTLNPTEPTAQEILAATQGKIIAKAQLVGTYELRR